MALVDIQVPDIGDFDEVGVIELLVKPGDIIKVEQSLITVESDKASMEIPSSHAGQVKELRVQVGDKVKEGSVLLTLEVAGAAGAANAAGAAEPTTPTAAAAAPPAAPASSSPAAAPPPPPPTPRAPRWGPRLRRPGRGPRPAHRQPFPPSSQARPGPACRMPRRRCASSPANWACPSRKSRARAPRVASRWTTCKPSPGR